MLIVENTQFNPADFTAIQNKLLLATGTSENIDEMLQSFMIAATEQLKLSNAYVYLLDSAHAESDSNTDNSTFHYYLSYADNHKQLPHLHAQIESSLKRLCPCNEEPLDIVEIDGLQYFIYCLKNIGAIIFEFEHKDFPLNMANVLTPVMYRLALACSTCFSIGKLKNRIRLNKELEKTFEQQANQDPLTKLPNRRAFRYNLYQEIANTRRYNNYGAVLYIDLDHFKNINDSLGHSVGDMLLTKVADRFKRDARAGDDVYRLGGDEFVYILRNVGNTETLAMSTAQSVARRMLDSMSEPMQVGDYALHVTPSIGVTVFPDKNSDENDSESVLKHADTAMYKAKSDGRNTFAFYDPEMQISASKRLILEDYLRKAINNGELHMEYQPIVNAHEEIIAAESLIRWKNPALGTVSPDEFIGIAEESNLMLDLSNWIMHSTCAFIKDLKSVTANNASFRYVTINISPKQFKQQNFVPTLLDILKTYDLSPDDIRLEFTENILIDNLDDTIKKMEDLLASNIKFILDDFGTGYSSLSYLQKLPIRTIKIDQSFVTGFKYKSYANKAIVDAIIAMADRMDLQCVIEGVETKDDADYFIGKNIYAMQGYYYYRPLSGNGLIDLLCHDQKKAVSE
jgi:diguanylate cyclase (GGDEF)-like protein